MTTSTPTGRVFALPDLVGVKAAQAIEQLRALGLTPVPLASVVPDVDQAGYVLGLDPPATTQVRAKARITLSVATHPDFDGRAEAGIAEPLSAPVQPPLHWPQSAPAGIATPEPEYDPSALNGAPTSAATPDVSFAPAPPPPGDAAFGEFPQDGGSSRADSATVGVAAESYVDDLSAPVPTPGDFAALDEWDRLRNDEASRFVDEHVPAEGGATVEAPVIRPSVAGGEQTDLERERAAEEKAKHDARRRSARRYRRLTFKQKLIVAGVFALTLLLVVAAASNHKPHADRTAKKTVATHTTTHSTPVKKHPAPTKHKPPVKPKRRVIVRTRTRTRTKVVTVTVKTPTTPVPTDNTSSYVPPASTGNVDNYTPTTPVASETHAPTSTVATDTQAPTHTVASATHTTSRAAPTKRPTSSASSSKPAHTHASAEPTSSGTGGASTLQNPDGATAPPNPTQP
jgi:hypothetical protein